MRRNHALAALVIGVGTLRYFDRIADLLLCQIGVFAPEPELKIVELPERGDEKK